MEDNLVRIYHIEMCAGNALYIGFAIVIVSFLVNLIKFFLKSLLFFLEFILCFNLLLFLSFLTSVYDSTIA